MVQWKVLKTCSPKLRWVYATNQTRGLNSPVVCWKQTNLTLAFTSGAKSSDLVALSQATKHCKWSPGQERYLQQAGWVREPLSYTWAAGTAIPTGKKNQPSGQQCLFVFRFCSLIYLNQFNVFWRSVKGAGCLGHPYSFSAGPSFPGEGDG